jgi:hypothetical protein
MEAILFKREDDFYSLKVDGIVMATSNGMLVDYKLSLKNCQAIEHGYYLDELVEKEFPLLELTKHSTDSYVEEENLQLLSHRKTYIKAFQKALEILGDKKFSEDDMINCFKYARQSGLDETDVMQDTHKRYIQSLQKNEWDVEIVTTTRMENGKSGIDTPVIKPKLDSDGCLILKRI